MSYNSSLLRFPITCYSSNKLAYKSVSFSLILTTGYLCSFPLSYSSSFFSVRFYFPMSPRFSCGLKGSKTKTLFWSTEASFDGCAYVVTVQPSAANVTNALFFLCSFKQSKSAVRLKEDMKKIAAFPLNKQRDTTCPKVFGVSLLELQQQGLSKNGIPIVVWNIVEYLTQHGKLNGVTSS